MTHTVTLEMPASLYQWANRVAQATQRSVDAVVLDYIENSLPPLDDVPDDELESLAQLSLLDDAALWRVSDVALPEAQQDELTALLAGQSARPLTVTEYGRLETLLKEYGRLMVQKAHAWLLLARRGYQVPTRGTETSPH